MNYLIFDNSFDRLVPTTKSPFNPFSWAIDKGPQVISDIGDIGYQLLHFRFTILGPSSIYREIPIVGNNLANMLEDFPSFTLLGAITTPWLYISLLGLMIAKRFAPLF